MERRQLNWITGYIWGIADDVLRDLYVRGKYRDVILPMTVLRRLDAVLEDSKQAVLDMKVSLDEVGVVEQDQALRQAAGQAFYNTSKFTMRDLKARASRQQLKADFEAYLDGFSPNVQDILENFEFRNQIPRLSKADALGTLIEKLTSPDINLSPEPVKNSDGSIRHPGLDNHGMGSIFEELVRKFNEENNEEAGEHWTPRDAVRLMAKLIFLPIADEIESGTYLLYDGALGTGGMLTVAEETLQQLAREHGKEVATHLYGQEINAETYAICKADLLLKGEGDAADNIVGGPEHSTLSNDAFPSREFDFMLSNPPYGKSWKSDLERMGGKKEMRDPRFMIEHASDPEYSLVTRSSDGQMLFLVNMLSKMKKQTKLGSRIAEVHNGSSLFTGDAGQGESNIRRWIIENDWLEAIVALPLNMFYNTGIATYVWVLTNRKPEHRMGKVQLIDATKWFQPLRKNLGKKNCELSEADITRVCEAFLAFEETEESKIFDNEAFGYWKVTVERPLRIKIANPNHAYKAKEIKELKQAGERAEDASPVIKKIHRKGTAPDPLRGLFLTAIDGKPVVVEFEPDTDLRDTEQIPLMEEGGIEAFLEREVLPHAADAWYKADSVKIGYEVSFTRYFYKPQPMRTLEDIHADILALEKETEGLLGEIIGGGQVTGYPLRHISIRVPWHDAGWKGTVCDAPQLNGACAMLKQIAGAKKEEAEIHIAGASLAELSRDQWPCCVNERATFMAPFEMEQEKRHALAKKNTKHYGHFQPTPQRYPAYSAGVVPFLWMMRDKLEEYGDRLELDVDASREPDLGYHTNWVHEAGNQTALLDGFAAHLRSKDSLCLFYAKHVPFIEGTGRILIGAGRVSDIGPLTEYARNGDGPRGMLWERPIQHSIRPNGKDGFLMPYHEVLQSTAEYHSLDLEPYTALAPSEHWGEFSYGSELVTHDGAISALLSMETALGRIEHDMGIATANQRHWIHDELVRLWKVRGPFPGLGAVLHAFGLSRGVFVAHALQQRAGENADPWPEVDAAFRDPTAVLPAELQRDLKELAPIWKGLPDQRRSLLRLLSRFELDVDQARSLYDKESRRKRGWEATDVEILQNPYRLFEISRHDPECVHLLTVDRGVFPEDTVRILHPLEAPSGLESAVDPRRVRAFTISVLEEAASAGHTLQFSGDLAETIREFAVRPGCPVTSDILNASVGDMAPEVVAVEAEGEQALQLDRYREIGEVVRKNVRGRVAGKRHNVDNDWTKLLAKEFGPETDEEERLAREEKAKSLVELAESRFSVLAGPAGAGKTSVLGILCAQDAIKQDGLLLLAPTGKARVRMQQLAGGAGIQAMTIAQFLKRNGRYDGYSGRYHLSDRPKATAYGTVIVDEASMLTEDMLGALLDALQGVKRLILVGDPAQLPPIGAGRPFVDIISELRPDDNESRFPRVAPGYSELTIERRQVGTERPDLRLARWFSASPPSPGEDDIFTVGDREHRTLRFVEWEKSEDFQPKLLDVLAEELELADTEDLRGFNRAMGSTPSGDFDYFNATRNGKTGAVAQVEAWQILSPLRGMPFGVGDINRQIHERFRAGFMDLASRQWNRPIPKPLGAERIVYGDKVINLSNHQRDGWRVYPQEGALGYLANGEIGVVVGQWKTNGYPKLLKVEFSSQDGYSYNFFSKDFREEGNAALELAYALTVHKAQGSQFGLVILVLPEGHPILSRELVYTALTRHQDRVVVMHQGQRSLLKDFAALHRSETARRRTNLLADCRMLEFPQAQGSVFLQEGLIHRTSKGLAVRSKSELLIAEAFGSAGVDFEYEKPLTLGGQTRYPDFTIEDEISGRTVYWEHLGMLARADYRTAWEKKLAWYRANSVHPIGEGDSGEAVLVITIDSAESGLDMGQVKKLIAEMCGG